MDLSIPPARTAAGIGAALLAVATAALAAGCALFRQQAAEDIVTALQEEAREEIRVVVTDPQREEAMLATLGELHGLMAQSDALLRALKERERQLFADYDSTREDYARLFAANRQERQTLQQEILRTHLALKTQAEADEWPRISAAQSRAVAARVEALGALIIAN